MQMVIVGNLQVKVFQSVSFPDQSFARGILGFYIKRGKLFALLLP